MENFGEYPREYIRPFMMGIELLEQARIRLFRTRRRSIFQSQWALVILIPSCLCLAFSMILDFFKLIADDVALIEIVNALPVVLIVIQAIMKTIVIVPNRKKIGNLIKNISDIWPKDEDLSESQIVIKNMHLRRLDICNKVFYLVNIGGAWQYVLTPLADAVFRSVFGLGEARLALPLGGVFPFDPMQTWLRYGLVYTFQVICIMKHVYCLLGPEILIISLCAHLSTLFTLLRNDLLALGPGSLETEADEENTSLVHDGSDKGLKYIVKRHQKLILFSEIFDDIFNRIIFVDLLFATITISFFAMVSKLASGPGELARNCVGIVATILPIFNLCYYGQILIDASTGLNESAYFNIWYKRDVRYQKVLFMFMIRCRKPCCLTSLRYSPVTLNSFTTVLSTTWSYFSLASTVIEGN